MKIKGKGLFLAMLMTLIGMTLACSNKTDSDGTDSDEANSDGSNENEITKENNFLYSCSLADVTKTDSGCIEAYAKKKGSASFLKCSTKEGESKENTEKCSGTKNATCTIGTGNKEARLVFIDFSETALTSWQATCNKSKGQWKAE